MLPSDIGARRKTPRLAGIWRLSVALSLGVAVLIPIVQFATLFPLTVNVPTWDQWNFASIWRAYFHHEAVFPRLIAPFNGHFMFLPRVLFFVLGLLTRWNVRAEVLATYVAFAAILAIFVAMLARSDSRLLVVAAPVSAYLFYLDQSESFLAGMTLSEAMAVLGIVASIFFLTGRSLSRARFALALASAIAASLSWGIGLVAWPVGLLAILLRRERRRIEATVWCLTGGLFVLAAQRVFQESETRASIPKAFAFLLVLLGRPFSLKETPSVVEARGLGAAVLVLFSVLVLASFRRRELSPWVFVGVSGLAGATLIALGRAEHRFKEGEPIVQALVSHYVLAVSPLAVAILAMGGRTLIAWGDRARHPRRPVSAALLGLLVAAPLFQTAMASRAWIPAIRSSAATLSEGKRAILAGTITSEQIRMAFHRDPGLVFDGIEVLRRYHLSCFADFPDAAEADAIGPAVGNVDLVAGATAEPDRRFEVVLGRAWDIRGWAADDPYVGRPVDRLELFVDGAPVASAELGRRRPDLVKRFQRQAFLDCGWMITVPESALRKPKEHRLEIRVRDRRGQISPFWTGRILARSPAQEAWLNR